jgi:hypothetical protein
MYRSLDGTMRHFTPGQVASWLPNSSYLLLLLLLKVVGQLLLR